MPINQFADESEYSSHVPSTTESEVSLVKSTNDIKYDGVNVEVDSPKFGDILYLEDTGDSNNLTKHFIDGDSLNVSLLPDTYIPVGGVIENNGKILIHYYKGFNEGDNNSEWVSAWLYEIDATVDGNQHSIVFRQPKYSGYLTVGTFTYSSSTQEQFAQELDTWLRANQGGREAGGTWDYNWHCEYMENYNGVMKPIVIIDNVAGLQQYADNGIVASGCSAYANMSNSIPAYSEGIGYPRKNGGSGYSTGVNLKRMIEYWTSSTNIDPITKQISVNDDNNIVNKNQFDNNQYCSDLRNAYGTHEKYIESLMFDYQSLRGLNYYENGKAKELSYKLALRQHKNLSGTLIDTFPIQAWCASKSFNSDGLRVGDWYLPGILDYYKIMNRITYGGATSLANSDRLNKVLNKIGGSLINKSLPRFSCARITARYAWAVSWVGDATFYSFPESCRASCIAYINKEF